MIAEYEKAKIAERYRRGKLFRARAGEIVTWKASYGYRRIPRSTATGQAHHQIYEPEAAVVRRIFTDRAAGITVREICRRLNADAIPSPTGKPVWGTSTLCRLLRNEAYVGRVYYNRTESVPDRRPTRRNREVCATRTNGFPSTAPGSSPMSCSRPPAGSPPTTPSGARAAPNPANGCSKDLSNAVFAALAPTATRCAAATGAGTATTTTAYYCRNHDPLRAGGEQHRCPERNIRADALDAFVFDHIRAAITHPDQLLAGEQAVTLHTPIPDDELLSAELARLDRKIDAADTERRRLIDLYQGGFIELPEMQRRATEVSSAEKNCSTSEPASPTNEPHSPVTTSSAAACTTSPPASTPSSTPSTTSKNNSCCAYSLKTSGSPAGTSRSSCASPSTHHHPARPARQAHRHRTRAKCQVKTVCVPLVVCDGQGDRIHRGALGGDRIGDGAGFCRAARPVHADAVTPGCARGAAAAGAQRGARSRLWGAP